MRHWLVTILCLWGWGAYAQNTTVDPENLNAETLDSLLLIYVNRERRKKKQGPLVHDAMLDLPAKDHADYMAKYKYIGHFQRDKRKKTVQDRVNYFGGNSQFIGENVQMIPLNYEVEKSRGRLTYPQLAKILGDNWKQSKGHYQNMVDANYTSISHQFTMRSGRLYVCQVFSSTPFKPEYHYLKGEKRFIQPKKPCANCDHTREKLAKDQGYIGWYTVSNDSLYYWNVKYYNKSTRFRLGKNSPFWMRRKNNLNLIFGARGEIAVDVIHYEQFDCEGNGAFHNALYYDGYYLGYLDKKKVKSENIHTSPSLVKVYIAQVPEFNDDYFQVDYNYNKRNKPCVNNSIIFLRPDYFVPKDYFHIPKPQVSTQNQLATVDSIEIKIPFGRNITDEDTSIFKLLLSTLKNLAATNKKVEYISYTGVASIEGSHEINKKLIHKRGELIANCIASHYPNLALDQFFFENFIDFREGLELYGIEEFEKVSETKLRQYANQNRDEPNIEALLNNTRQSTVKIRFKSTIQFKSDQPVLTFENLKDLMALEKHEEATLLFQLLAHQAIDSAGTLRSDLLTMDLPTDPKFKTLLWYHFVYQLHVGKPVVDFDQLHDLYKIGAIPSEQRYLEYRLLFNLFNDNEAIPFKDFDKVVKGITSKREKAWVETLEMISGIRNYRYAEAELGPMVVNNVIQYKFNVFQTYFTCQYLIEWGYYVEALVLLSKFARQKKQFPKLYKQYIKIAYYLEHFLNESKYKRVLAVMKNLKTVSPEAFCDLFTWKQMGVRALDFPEIAELFCMNCRSTGYDD